jgi:hypothetical protein
MQVNTVNVELSIAKLTLKSSIKNEWTLYLFILIVTTPSNFPVARLLIGLLIVLDNTKSSHSWQLSEAPF